MLENSLDDSGSRGRSIAADQKRPTVRASEQSNTTQAILRSTNLLAAMAAPTNLYAGPLACQCWSDSLGERRKSRAPRHR